MAFICIPIAERLSVAIFVLDLENSPYPNADPMLPLNPPPRFITARDHLPESPDPNLSSTGSRLFFSQSPFSHISTFTSVLLLDLTYEACRPISATPFI
jgi:hypothetical protein